MTEVTIGVLALQGAFIEHIRMLERLDVLCREIRTTADLAGLDGLIIPGGESTVMGKLSASPYSDYLFDNLRARALNGFPIYGTCAGMIVLATNILDGVEGQPSIGVMDVAVRRNAFGRQIDSFVTQLSIPVLDDIGSRDEKGSPFPAVFIRAPLIEDVAKNVRVLATLQNDTIVAVRQGNLLASSFHPELTHDTRFHELFLKMVKAT